ncbi:unnamed protein product [Phytophthora fragariaefolia]|uniref:Unnamed protein product n=1 Tax=Phytophthora fragariaefolia TaxID=1490495 RepID=A0A9W7CXI6_9STRA|nr:unnamed protein product [Phytophthora fragariaefolia]
MGKELTVDQKATAETHAARGAADGAVGGYNCDKEITPCSIDRCASSTSGYVRTSEGAGAHIAKAVPPAPVHGPHRSYSKSCDVFKVHVSKDYMKFNAAHFIAYKVLVVYTTLSSLRVTS